MAGRTPADPSARLKLLVAARKKAEAGDVVNHAEMAKTLGMTARNLTFTTEKDAEFPILSRGGEGVAYSYDVVAVLDHMIARCRAAIGDRRERAARMARLAGAPELEAAIETEDDPLSAKEIKDIVDATVATHKLKLAQGRYVLRDAVTAFLTDYNGQFQAETLGLLGKVDPAGEWPPQVRKKVEDAMRTLLVTLQGNLDRFIAQPGATAAS